MAGMMVCRPATNEVHRYIIRQAKSRRLPASDPITGGLAPVDFDIRLCVFPSLPSPQPRPSLEVSTCLCARPKNSPLLKLARHVIPAKSNIVENLKARFGTQAP